MGVRENELSGTNENLEKNMFEVDQTFYDPINKEVFFFD